MMSDERGSDGGDIEEGIDMVGNSSLMVLVGVGALEVVGGLSKLIRQGLIARVLGEEEKETRRSDEERGRGGMKQGGKLD